MKETAQVAYDNFMESVNSPNSTPTWAEMPEAHKAHWRAAIDAALLHDRLFVPKFGENEPPWVARIEAQQNKLLEEMKTMADNQVQLDSAITDVSTALATLGTDLTQAIADLEEKVAGTGVDFTPEVTQLQTIASSLTSLTATVTAADPGAPATGSTPPAGSTSTGS